MIFQVCKNIYSTIKILTSKFLIEFNKNKVELIHKNTLKLSRYGEKMINMVACRFNLYRLALLVKEFCLFLLVFLCRMKFKTTFL
jgi:hypothetical protein